MAVVSSRGGVNAGIDPFAEHTSIMKALYHDYQRRDELEGVALVEALLHEAAQACKQKEESAKNLVRDLSKSVKELEALSTYPEPDGFHTKRLEALQAEIGTASSGTAEQQACIKQLEDKMAALSERTRAATTRKASLERMVAADEPMLRHQLSLFAHISKISWKLNQEEGHIAGTVSDPKTGDLRPFDMADAKNKNAFQVVNSLWDIL